MTDQHLLEPLDGAVDDYGLPLRSRHAPSVLRGTYGEHTFWNLAPMDPIVAQQHDADMAQCEFVWLTRAGVVSWALVNVTEHRIVALDPAPRDMRTRAALRYRQDSPTPEGATP